MAFLSRHICKKSGLGPTIAETHTLVYSKTSPKKLGLCLDIKEFREGNLHGIKFIHTADWHLGKNLHEHRLLEDQRKVLWDLLDLIDRESPDFLIVAGDIFDRSVPPAEALALLGEFLSELRSRSALPVVFLGGNHDSPSRLSYGAELFSIQDIYFRSLPRSFTSPVEIKAGGQKVQIWCLPFLRKYDLLPEDLAPMEKSETVGAEDSFFPETDDYEELSLYESALKRIRSLQDPQAKQILTAHLLTLGGSVSDSERPLVGGLGEIPSQWLEGFDYVALGASPPTPGASARHPLFRFTPGLQLLRGIGSESLEDCRNQQ
jgi:exonuclease SbcD